MDKFPKIAAFHNIVKSVRHMNDSPYVDDVLKALEPVSFIGTVKLHGTNASVVCTPDGLQCRSRNREISVENDNCGFARFIAGEAQAKVIRHIEDNVRFDYDLGLETDRPPVTIYGEWCGKGIMKGCGIHSLDLMFVVFAASIGSGDSVEFVAPPFVDEPSASIYHIERVPAYEVTIDFSNEESIRESAKFMEGLVLKVEKQCPFAASFDAIGIGEGIVWTPLGKYSHRTDLWFKTKGQKHRVEGGKSKTNIRVSPEILAGVKAFVDATVTMDRLEQGIGYLTELGLSAERKTTGLFLKWIAKDIADECSDELEASGLTWKMVQRDVTRRAATYFKSVS